jgi:hypothetical protein
MTESSREVERRRTVRQLWQELYTEDERTGRNVLAFHLWLEQNRPELLHLGHGDLAYQHLKSDLDGLWRD